MRATTYNHRQTRSPRSSTRPSRPQHRLHSLPQSTNRLKGHWSTNRPTVTNLQLRYDHPIRQVAHLQSQTLLDPQEPLLELLAFLTPSISTTTQPKPSPRLLTLPLLSLVVSPYPQLFSSLASIYLLRPTHHYYKSFCEPSPTSLYPPSHYGVSYTSSGLPRSSHNSSSAQLNLTQ